MASRQLLRATGLWVWSVILTALTIVLGAAPLKSLRHELGRLGYWPVGMAATALLWLLQLKVFSILYFTLVVLVGLFGEWEELGLSFLSSVFFSVLVSTMLAAAGVMVWIAQAGSQWKDVVIGKLDEMIKPAVSISPSLQVNATDILLQLPSIIIVLWLAALYLSALLERRVSPEGLNRHPSFRSELDKINLPSVVIWAFILALLGTFGEFNLNYVQTVSVNVLNICLMLFFFQGLAVIYRFFSVFRVGFFWQTLLMIIIVGQLFLLVSLLGLVDHWVDFRTRLSKRREEMNKELQ